MDGRQVHDELLSFAKEHGVDLSDIQLDLDYDRDYCRVYFGIYTLETDEEYNSGPLPKLLILKISRGRNSFNMKH